MLGRDAPFELEWVSVYQFACRRIDQFKHGRVIFAGDAAHQVSPFGARGANTGVQDIDNLIWKLQLVMQGRAGPALLDSYHAERAFAADDNLRNSTRSTDYQLLVLVPWLRHSKDLLPLVPQDLPIGISQQKSVPMDRQPVATRAIKTGNVWSAGLG